jgi:hypothetical protein
MLRIVNSVDLYLKLKFPLFIALKTKFFRNTFSPLLTNHEGFAWIGYISTVQNQLQNEQTIVDI